MRALIACEASQVVCKAFRERGHEAHSCDLKECYGGHPEWHYKEDIMHLLPSMFLSLYFLGFHPVCRYLANSGVRWLTSKKERDGYEWSEEFEIYMNWDRYKKMQKAALFFKSALSYVKTVGRGYVENPIIHKYALAIISEEPTQIIQPTQFGHTTRKATCLWIYGLPKLKPTKIIPKEQWTFEIHKEPPGPNREKNRSETFPGIANAMAKQWG